MRQHWQVLLSKDEQGTISAYLYEESGDGLDMVLIADGEWGPFDTASDIGAWLVRHWALRAKLLLR